MSTAPAPAALTHEEADTLRAYIPLTTLQEIAALSKAECAECDKRSVEYRAITNAIGAAKERMKKDRATLKELERKRKEHFSFIAFKKTDAARAAAWEAARLARSAAIAAGEAPKIETYEACSARVNAA